MIYNNQAVEGLGHQGISINDMMKSVSINTLVEHNMWPLIANSGQPLSPSSIKQYGTDVLLGIRFVTLDVAQGICDASKTEFETKLSKKREAETASLNETLAKVESELVKSTSQIEYNNGEIHRLGEQVRQLQEEKNHLQVQIDRQKQLIQAISNLLNSSDGHARAMVSDSDGSYITSTSTSSSLDPPNNRLDNSDSWTQFDGLDDLDQSIEDFMNMKPVEDLMNMEPGDEALMNSV